jgi:hypothetical protein
MRANPGGLISSEETVGRDQLIEIIWRRLEGQSVLLTSERRIGKTSVIRKMQKAPLQSDWCVVRDLEGLHSPGEFIETIYLDLAPILSRGERAKQKFFATLKALGDVQIKDIKMSKFQPHWKSLLIDVISDAVEAHKGRLVFFWDEMPLFIYNVAKMCGSQEAMMLLDTLRSIRQNYSTIRMVFTGSVGMHQVVQKLRKEGYANAPTNDMAVIEVPPLDTDDAKNLALSLLVGEQIEAMDGAEEIAALISEAASDIPFYIHTIVARIRDDSHSIDKVGAIAHADKLIKDSNDPADFGYYVKRLVTYYESEKADLALIILDVLAASEHAYVFTRLSSAVNHVRQVADEQIRQTLEMLSKDHYILRNATGQYSFRYKIVQKWWQYARG